MKRTASAVAAIVLICLSLTSQAQISGTVFKDFNFNGTQEASAPVEPGVFGVQVKTFNAAGIQMATTKTTSAAGAYSFSAAEIPLGTAVRVEFTAPPGSLDAKFAATTSGSSIQFVTAGAGVTANYAISSQQWYSSTMNPYVATNTATNGDPTLTGTAATNTNLYVFPYDMGNGTANDGGPTRRLTNAALGSVYGLTSQKSTRTIFMAAYLKRHVGFGPNGIGAIYKSVVQANGTPGVASLLVDVNTIGLNVGTTPRTAGNLPANSNTQNADPNTFSEIGKRGIGGITLNEDGSALYLVNMFQNRLQRINIGNPVKATITSADVTGDWALPNPATAGMAFHPMACKSANGKIYVGGVVVFEKTTAHNLATDTVGARGIVYEFDTAAATFTEVLRFPFNYRRGFANSDTRFPFKANWWCEWQNNGAGGAADPLRADYNTAGAGAFTGGIYYPQPMLSDIEFDITGEIIIGVRDRFGDQMGYQNVSTDNLPTGPTGFGGNNFFRALSSGEVLRAGKNAGVNSYTLENLGAVINNGVTTTTAGVAGGNPSVVGGNWTTAAGTPWGGFYGPGWGGSGTVPAGGPNPGTQGAYFYYNHNFSFTNTPGTLNSSGTGAPVTGHYFKSDGSLALLAGSGEVVHTVMDPENTSYAQGVGKMFNSGTATTVGNMSQRMQLVTTTTTPAPGDPTNMGKAGGMCDIEILTEYQPIEVGNRIWNDANGNGIQDAGESGINALTVQLYGPGADLTFGTADDILLATTATLGNGGYVFNTLTTADARKPVSFIGVGNNDILPGFSYQIRVTAPAGFRLTSTDAGLNGYDLIDNDASMIGANAVVTFSTSGINHNFDIGFKQLAALGDRVWLDNGAGGGTAGDGLQNGTEPGVSGVPVNLYKNGADGLPGTADDVLVGTTITDAYGNYLFDNLTPTTYNVRVTPPANYSFTTQTNTTDVFTGTFATGSDVNPLGISYTITLASGQINPNIDAGLIFNTPAALSSIGDFVWFDTNGNGAQDAGEPGVSGITVTLYDAATGNTLAITTTDGTGSYIFNNLPTGTYTVGFSAPGGTVLTTSAGTTAGNATTNSDPDPATGRTTTITISVAGTQITGIDAGIKNDPNSALGDFVWNDLNHNGIQDAGEPGIPGVTMQLYNPGANNVAGGGDDVLLSTTSTDANGYYIFPNLASGKYFVVATAPAGYTLTLLKVTAGNTGLSTKDNDFSAGTAPYAGKNVSPVYTLTTSGAGVTRDLTVDMGIYNSLATLHSIGDFVWNDMSANGTQDAGEPGVSNVSVRLYNGSGVAVNNPATGKPYVITTDANGGYKFVDLPDGTYIVEFVNIPVGYSFNQTDASGSGAPGSGTDGTTDSDIKTSTGRTAVVTLAGANITNVDGGISQGAAVGAASLGNRVWYDVNGNGLQDAGEMGVPGVKVELLDGTGAAVDGDPVTAGVQNYIVYTNGLGEYSFTNLAAGDYQVKFSNFPAGYTSSATNTGTNDEIDGDANFAGISVTATTTATTGTYTLQKGEDNLSVDMGIIPAAGTNRLGDFVWNDVNQNGIQDAGEPGVQGVNVSLYTNGADLLPGTTDDVFIKVTTTDSLGRYAFTGLADGNYNVGFTNLPAGYKFSDQNAAGSTAANGSDANTASGRTGTIGLDPTSITATTVVNNDVDAGIFTANAALGNYVWLDLNGDGIQDATEKGIPGVTVTLYAADGTTVLASAITDASGKYYFGNLTPGTFVVGFGTGPSGLSFTAQNTPGDNGNNTNSDADPSTGKTTVITLSAAETDLTIDAGFKPDNFADVGDFVWNDTNGNNVQNPSEPGLSGILATVYNASNVAIGTAVTDGNGYYRISKLTPGTVYHIIFSNLPASAVFVTQTDNVSSSDVTLGSDANSSTGRTSDFILAANEYRPTVDAGIKQVFILPVKIISFTAKPESGKVRLDWSVAEQQDIVTYEAQFSTDAGNFITIATVAANHNSDASYNAYHLSPVAGINYYRIRITDNSGRISFSGIRKVNIGKDGTISFYPVPAHDILNLTVAGGIINKAATISIIGADGRLLSQKKVNSMGQTESLDVSKLSNGNYIVRITTDTDVVVKTIEVIH